MTQADALDILKMGQNVYLTGQAGSGKTYVLNQYIQYLRKHDVEVAVTASTGIAATHLGGMTIHSWSGIGVRDQLLPPDLEALEEKPYLWKRFQHTRVLIIDEVSMLHHFRLDLVDTVCRAMRRNDTPFGGLQVVLCGDFFQLPPVSRLGEPQARFVHESNAWRTMGLRICYLQEQHRQKDPTLLKLLNDIRSNGVNNNIIHVLRSRAHQSVPNTGKPTRLYTHNMDVDRINDEELSKLPGETRAYTMKGKGKDAILAVLKNTCLAPEILRLKKNAQVMFVKNNTEAGYANGTLGTVIDFDDEKTPIVKTLSDATITAEPMDWHISEDGRVLAEVQQVPLRLAWAITVHKSQGMSLDAVEVDLSKSFEPGMGYVALSRVRSLAGLTLLGFNSMALAVHPEVIQLDVHLQQASNTAAEELARFTSTDKKTLHETFVGLVKPKRTNKKIPTHRRTKECILNHQPLKDIATARKMTVGTILNHLEQLKTEDPTLDLSYLQHGTIDNTRFNAIVQAFASTANKNPDRHLAPIKAILGKRFTFEEIRFVRLLL